VRKVRVKDVMKTGYKKRNQAAGTLAEVLAAVAILAISIAGLMGALANGFHTVQIARENERASQIMTERMELLRLYSWDQVNTPGVIPTKFTEAYDPQSVGAGSLVYTGTVTVAASTLPANYSANIKQVTLNLQWSSQNVLRKRSVTTLVAKNGYQNYVY
jgi:hypothetical protein